MVRIHRVYTRSGDKGSTRLAGGQKVDKASPRIEAYGTVDELNAVLGVVVAAAEAAPELAILVGRILRIQNELFDLGSQLAVLKADRRPDTPVVAPTDVTRLEHEIDEMNTELPPLQSFVLPGGGMISAQMHVARTVCRRAERRLCALAAVDELDGTEIPYLNRLGDWLFVAARYVSAKLGRAEVLWRPGVR
jgi:cob(I)alamin adenosyltransferase